MSALLALLMVATGTCTRVGVDVFECGPVTVSRCAGFLECGRWGAVAEAVANGETDAEALEKVTRIQSEPVERELKNAKASVQAAIGGTLWAVPPLELTSRELHFACFAPSGQERACIRALESLAPLSRGFAPKKVARKKPAAKASPRPSSSSTGPTPRCRTSREGAVTTTDCSQSRLRVVRHERLLDASQRVEAMTRSLRTLSMRAQMRGCSFRGAPTTCAVLNAKGGLWVVQGFAEVEGQPWSFQCEWTERGQRQLSGSGLPQACAGMALR